MKWESADEQTIQDIGNGRDYTKLIYLNPGVADLPTNSDSPGLR